MATNEGYILVEPSELPQQPPLTEETDSTQSHLVYRHTPSNFHSDETCLTTHTGNKFYRSGKVRWLFNLWLQNHVMYIPPHDSTAAAQESSSSSDHLLRRRRKRSFDADEYFVETTIVADQSMLDYHRMEDLEAYIYTLMNIVSQFGQKCMC